MNQKTRSSFWQNVSGTLLLVMLSALLVGVYVERLAIQDWFRLRGYTPPAAIAALAAEDRLTPEAKHIFYVNHPELNTRTDFNDNCPNNGGEQTIVLGCYHGNQAGIYLFDVKDSRLNGVEQVTAAHEMLHAAYDRLNTKERKRVDALLKDYYQNGLHDSRLKEVIASYKKTEPNDIVNEMHSVFGTEATNLPAPLETYYKRYFVDRSRITGYAKRYQNEFTSRKDQVSAYDRQLAAIKKQIDPLQTTLDSQSSSLNALRVKLGVERAAVNTNPESYNAQVRSYNASVAGYNAQLAQLKALIAQYNQIVDRRNTLALEEQELSQAIDSTLAPISH